MLRLSMLPERFIYPREDRPIRDLLRKRTRISKETIDYWTRQNTTIEKSVERKVELKPEYLLLQTIPGVGTILSLTIMMELGSISSFHGVGNYASYCRKVPTIWTSNDKKKGKGNKNNGNRYLA